MVEALMHPQPSTLLPNPRRWLLQGLEDTSRTQRELARAVGSSTPQVSRWLSGKEEVPYGALMMAADFFGERDRDFVTALFGIKQLSHELPKATARKLAIETSIASAVSSKLVETAATAATQVAGSGPTGVKLLHDNLLKCHQLLTVANECLYDEEPLITPTNVARHLTYPFNVLTGDLISSAQQHGLDTVFDGIYRSVERTAKAGWKERHLDTHEGYCVQHAFHLMGRYGMATQRANALSIMSARRDVGTRRTQHYAALAGKSDPRAAERFLYELRRDPALRQMNLEFDLVHYGDVRLADGVAQSFTRTVANLVRHIHDRAGTPEAELAYDKLVSLVQGHGVRVVDAKRTRERISRVLMRIQNTDPTRRTTMEAEFLEIFGRLPLFLPYSAVQLELAI